MRQVFVTRQLAERFVSKGESVSEAHMDFEEVCDRTDRNAMWRVLGMYGMSKKFL